MVMLPPRQIVTIEGESIEYVRAGSGEVAVVLVNGSGGPIEGWHKVFAPLTAHAQVFAYNRPGIGRSSKPVSPQIASRMVTSLRAALLAAGMRPPYVLVGHSLGGLIVNLYARLHPAEAKAAVMLEATSPDDPAVLSTHRNGLQRALHGMMEWLAPPDPNSETLHLPTSVLEIRAAPSFPAIPLTVITGGKPAMSWATPREALAARRDHQRALTALSPLGKQIVATRSGHFPQFTEGALVVTAIEEMIDHPSLPDSIRSTRS